MTDSTEKGPNVPKLSEAKSLTLTFLAPVSLGSLNGSDKEADNVSSIKKLTRGSRTYPYVSSQALRRALREQLAVLKYELSEGVAAREKKGAAITKCAPKQYIDDDLFGFMDAAKGGTHKRTGPVRVSPLLALDPYEGDLDFGTNYMGAKSGGTPNIFETEIHGGLYRGTVLIELDAVGRSRDGESAIADKKEAWELAPAEKAGRVSALLTAIQHLWSGGRQSRFLADISPKFLAAAVTTAKVPLFLESVRRKGDGIDVDALGEAVSDARTITAAHCFGARAGMFDPVPEGCLSVGQAFEAIQGWVASVYGA